MNCFRQPLLHFVEEVALQPAEVAVDSELMLRNEAELNEAAHAPLPDMDQDDADL